MKKYVSSAVVRNPPAKLSRANREPIFHRIVRVAGEMRSRLAATTGSTAADRRAYNRIGAAATQA
jgi:hypothetical protein